MLRKPTLSSASVFVFCGLLIAQEWWEKIPCTEWSDERLLIFLEFSPWVRHSKTFLIRKTTGRDIDNYPRFDDYPEYYVVRLLTAQPVREALLQAASKRPGMVLSLDESKKSDAEVREERLWEFIASNPESVVVKGDKKHIVISMMLISGAYPPFLQGEHIIFRVLILNQFIARFRGAPPIWQQNLTTNQLSEFTLSKPITDTSLETDTGKRMELFEYRLPESDGLGAKFFFKRQMPDGTSFITADDKELHFKTRLDDRRIRVTFDLEKMIYKGKLEY